MLHKESPGCCSKPECLTTVWSESQLVEYLVQASHNRFPPSSTLPSTIDLSPSKWHQSIGQACKQMLIQTIKDRKHRERIRFGKIGFNDQLILLSTTIGEHNFVHNQTTLDTRFTFDSQGRPYFEQETLAIAIHSHVLPLPPSPKDLCNLIQKPNINSTTAAIILTTSIHSLLLRTKETQSKPTIAWLFKQEEYLASEIQKAVLLHPLSIYLQEAPIERWLWLLEQCEKLNLALYIAYPNSNHYLYHRYLPKIAV